MKKRSGKQAGTRKITRRRRPSSQSVAVPRTAVFLVGFMGAGKTSVGRALGERLNWVFEDLDDRIVQAERRSVAEIFRDPGERAFRRIEHEILRQVLQELRGGVARVVALGGGAFAQAENAALLKAAGMPTVFLEAPVDELWDRCRRQAEETGAQRPLLQSVEQFRKLHADRRKSYTKAELKVKTAKREVEEIAAEIAKKLKLKSIAVRTEQGDDE